MPMLDTHFGGLSKHVTPTLHTHDGVASRNVLPSLHAQPRRAREDVSPTDDLSNPQWAATEQLALDIREASSGVLNINSPHVNNSMKILVVSMANPLLCYPSSACK
jgi:hypothetical protein